MPNKWQIKKSYFEAFLNKKLINQDI